MNACITCFHNRHQYNEHGNLNKYCHITMIPLTHEKHECKDYKPRNMKKHIKRELDNIKSNQEAIQLMTGDKQEYDIFRCIHEYTNETITRVNELQHYWEND